MGLSDLEAENALLKQLLAAKSDALQAKSELLEQARTELATERRSHQVGLKRAAEDLAHEQKRARAEVITQSALDSEETLNRVFKCVGDMDYFYVASVCRTWRGQYMSYCRRARKLKQNDRLRLRTEWQSAVT